MTTWPQAEGMLPAFLPESLANPLSKAEQQKLLAELTRHLVDSRARSIGYPGATDIDWSLLAPLHLRLVNNVGDPESGGRWRVHTKDLECELIGALAGLFGGSMERSWGYVTAGGSSEGVLHSLWLGRERFWPATPRLYHSSAVHYCVAKAAHLLGLEVSEVAADPRGEMIYDSFAAAVWPHRDQPALVVATAGTTMTEAIDDLAQIHAALDTARVRHRHVVVDAALAGPALALDGGPIARLLGDDGGPGRVDADAVVFSGHKSFGTPHVCGVVLTRRTFVERFERMVDYLGGRETTISGSRSGHAPVELWYVLTEYGLDGLRERARRARDVARHTVRRLTELGWEAWRHPHAWTVVLDAPPHGLAAAWQLATSGGRSHIVCVPGITPALIDSFVAELTAAIRHTETDHA